MANKIQPRLKDAVERFCTENPDLFFSRENKIWFKDNGQYYEDATNEFENKTSQIWEEYELLYDVHLKNLRKLCAIKKSLNGPLNEDSEMLLNTPDGVIDLLKLSNLHNAGFNHKEYLSDWILSHSELGNKHLTEIMNASYNNNSLPPEKFLGFIEELFQYDNELINYFMKFLAYCLTGKISQQYFHIIYGIGRNGKSTLLNIVKEIFGTYFISINSNLIEIQNDDNITQSIFYRNRFKRLILFNEQNAKFKLDLATIKLLTGDDFIPVHVNQKDIEFKGQFKILFNTNHIPAVGSIENRGIWDRLRILITRPPIPEEQRIEDFYKSIIVEKDQILTYVIDNYLFDSLGSGLKEKPKVMTLTKLFKEFSENPTEFFFDRTITLSHTPLNKRQWIPANYLYGQYCQFHLFTSRAFELMLKISDGNISRKMLVSKIFETNFARKMEALGAVKKKKSSMYYTNIYFHAEQVYSEFGVNNEFKSIDDFRSHYIDLYEKSYVQKRRFEEANAPIVQAYDMIKMVNETENYFEEPSTAENMLNTLPPFMKNMFQYQQKQK